MRALIRVTGAVQGIGYRPFVAELASKYELSGEVKNLGGIVEIIAMGDEESIDRFKNELESSSPAGSIVINVSLEYLTESEPEGQKDHSGFRIVESREDFDNSYLPVFPPDIGICPDCMRELLDEGDRRYRYPLISCASCGPRFSILKKLPYDRETTTMDVFSMCPECADEYGRGRRRHAQTISCHHCGPQMTLFNGENGNKFSGDAAISEAIRILKKGGILGLKGVGGYQLVTDPYNYEAVTRLRDIKGREQKPFAVMFDSVGDIRKLCIVSDMEEEYLTSSARPIVLLDKTDNSGDLETKYFADNVCGNSRQIGAFLPSTGVHKLLIMAMGPLIVTSGNVSGEPMIIADEEFRNRFEDKNDGILLYDREILRPLDDSVLQIIKNYDGREIPRFIRRARGYVPLPVFLNNMLPEGRLYKAYGADLKNSFAIGYGDRIIGSQFFGDMENYGVLKLWEKEFPEFNRLFRTDSLEADKTYVISDMHPGYHSTALADKSCENADRVRIQHHHAHIGSVMAENGLKECIGVAFDGTGYGTDGTIWGSEFLICRGANFERGAHLKPVRMVGRDEAMKNAGISAACYLSGAGLDIPEDVLSGDSKALISAALKAGIDAFDNSGMGRLFDAVSCILGICSYNTYEGECAIALQNKAEEYLENKESFSDVKNVSIGKELPEIEIIEQNGSYEFSADKLLAELLNLRSTKDAGMLAYAFHEALARATVNTCKMLRNKSGLSTICLSGGVFANRLLLGLCERLLTDEGFVVYYNRVLPTNDQGISVGQIYLSALMSD